MELNKRKKSLLIKYIVIGVLCLALGFGSGYIVFHNSNANANEKTNLTLVDEVVDLLNNNWLDTTFSNIYSRSYDSRVSKWSRRLTFLFYVFSGK